MANEPNPPTYQVPPPGNGNGAPKRPLPDFSPKPPNRTMNGCLISFIVALVAGGGMAILLLLFAAAGAAANGGVGRIESQVEEKGSEATTIVIIPVNGIIQSGLSGSASSETLIEMLRMAGKDKHVKVIVLDMNTPGGEVTATDEVYHEIQKLRTEKNIKVVTCMRSVAASGGYYLAAGTDFIVANRLTMTGSIGVMIGGVNYSGLMKTQWWEVKSEVYKSGKMKDILNPARPRDDLEAGIIQEMVDESYREFQKIVEDGRKISHEKLEATPEIRDARVLTGRQALALGLVDKLGYLEDAIAEAKTLSGANDPRIVRYNLRPTLVETLLYGKTAAKPPQSLADIIVGKNPEVMKGQLYFLSPIAY